MRLRVLGGLAVVALILAACGDDDSDTEAGETTETTSGAEGSDTTAAPAADAVVGAAETQLGMVLVDAGGRTLYAFTNDSGGESSCTADCAVTWPPLTVDGDFAVGEGLNQDDFSTITRDDGSMQVAADGHPLYTFAGDEAAGDVNGQGVGDVWFAVDTDGGLVGAPDTGGEPGPY